MTRLDVTPTLTLLLIGGGDLMRRGIAYEERGGGI